MMKDAHSQMTAVRLSEGISLVFDQETLSGSRSRSRSSHGSSNHSSGSGSQAHRREACVGRRRHRSSSSTSSSSSSSSPRPRSRSHPRCHRAASRSCCSHSRRDRRSHHSSPRRYRAHSRSSSPSYPSPDRSFSRRSSRRSRSRSSARRTADHRKPRGSLRARSSKSTKTNRSRSRSPGRLTVTLNLDGKKADIWSASTKPGAEERPRLTTADPQPKSEGWVTLEPAFRKSPTQNSDLEPEDESSSPKMSPTRKGISFSINNSVAKPSRTAPSAESKVIHRVESYSSRAPYGHWVPVKRVAQTSLSRSSKHSLSASH